MVVCKTQREIKEIKAQCKIENIFNGRPKLTVYLSDKEREDDLFCCGLQGNIFDVFIARKEGIKLC